MTKIHCDCCDVVIPKTPVFDQRVTVRDGYQVDVDVKIRKDSANRDICMNCFRVIVAEFNDALNTSERTA